MTDASPALVVEGVAKRFGDHVVLDHVDLTVAAGTVTAVLGPSGGGKTTLLRIVAGFEAPDAGSVTVGGTVVVSPTAWVPPERRRIGMVPQEGALFPHLSVGDNVAFGLARGREADARVVEMLEMVGLPGTARMRPRQLSGGQQHRVALARALAPRPALVVLDEPFSSLDAGLRAQVRAEVLDVLRASGSTAVVVTHDQQEAMSVADQVAVLLDGRIAQAAAPVQLYDRPASVQVATFVGEAIVLPGSFDGRATTCALGRVDAAPADGVVPGPVDVVLRPEHLVLHRHQPNDGVPATVQGRTFFGHDAVVTARLDDGLVLTSRQHTVDLPAVGERVTVTVQGRAAVFTSTP